MPRILALALAVAAVAGCPGPASASAWLEPFGALRLGAGYGATSTRTQFAPGDAGGLTGPRCPQPVLGGDRMPYSCVTGGRYEQHSLFLEASAGVAPFLTLDVLVPIVLSASFEDDLGVTRVRGLGDVRFGLRAGGAVRGWALAAEVRVGAPSGPKGLEDRDIPLGEGQWDLELGGRAGRGFGRWGWAEVQTAVRVRVRSRAVHVDRGEEWFGSLSGGFTPIPQLGATLALDWIAAGPDVDSFGLRSPGRKLLQLRPGVLGRVGEDFSMGVAFAIPLAGQKWPAAVVFTAGVNGRIRFRPRRAPTH